MKGGQEMDTQIGLDSNKIKTIKRNSDMVYRLAYSQMKNKNDADDVYQEVFLRYIKNPQFLITMSTKKHGLYVSH